MEKSGWKKTMTRKLEGKIALVTDGSRGVGAAIFPYAQRRERGNRTGEQRRGAMIL